MSSPGPEGTRFGPLLRILEWASNKLAGYGDAECWRTSEFWEFGVNEAVLMPDAGAIRDPPSDHPIVAWLTRVLEWDDAVGRLVRRGRH